MDDLRDSTLSDRIFGVELVTQRGREFSPLKYEELYEVVEGWMQLHPEELDDVQIQSPDPKRVDITVGTGDVWDRRGIYRFIEKKYQLNSGRIIRIVKPCEKVKEIRIKRVPSWWSKEHVERIFSFYGNIRESYKERFQSNHDNQIKESWKGLKNGVWKVKMVVQKPIPSNLVISGYKIEIFYRGQIPTCWKCGRVCGVNHRRAECTFGYDQSINKFSFEDFPALPSVIDIPIQDSLDDMMDVTPVTSVAASAAPVTSMAAPATTVTSMAASAAPVTTMAASAAPVTLATSTHVTTMATSLMTTHTATVSVLTAPAVSPIPMTASAVSLIPMATSASDTTKAALTALVPPKGPLAALVPPKKPPTALLPSKAPPAKPVLLTAPPVGPLLPNVLSSAPGNLKTTPVVPVQPKAVPVVPATSKAPVTHKASAATSASKKLTSAASTSAVTAKLEGTGESSDGAGTISDAYNRLILGATNVDSDSTWTASSGEDQPPEKKFKIPSEDMAWEEVEESFWDDNRETRLSEKRQKQDTDDERIIIKINAGSIVNSDLSRDIKKKKNDY